jgi:hypothetical protein
MTMSVINTGSNYGIISTLNTGSGTFAGQSTFPLLYENVQNYTSCSILVQTSTNIMLQVNFSNTANGQMVSSESYMISANSAKTINFSPSGQYMQLVFVARNTLTLTGTYNVQTRFNNTSAENQDSGYLSGLNSFIGVTGSVSSSFTGTYELVENYSLITIFASGTLAIGAIGPASGFIDCKFSNDGINTDRVIRYTIQDVTASDGYTSGATSSICFNPPHTLVPISRYFQMKYTNNAVAVHPLNISVMYHKNKSKLLTNTIADQITDYQDADISRSILTSKLWGSSLPGGNYQNIGLSNSVYDGIGHLTTSIKEPISAFGEILTANVTPIAQIDFAQGRPLDTIVTNSNILYTPPGTTGGYYKFENSMATIGITGNTNFGGTGTSVNVQGNQLLLYKSGQGIESKFTTIYPNVSTVGVTGCNVYNGLYNKESSITFGYFYEDGPSGSVINPLIYNKFAIRHQNKGKQQLNRFILGGTVNTIASSVTLTFGSKVIIVPTAASETLQTTCYNIVNAIEILNPALNTWGWLAEYYFINGVTSSCYIDLKYNYSTNTQISVSIATTGTLTSTSSVLRSGQQCTNNYYIQYGATGQNVNLWNIDRCYDQGSLQQNYLYNPSGFRLIPSNGNVYKITIQYLGFGAITMYIESPNIGLFIPIHQIKWANNNTSTNFSDPSFRPTLAIENFTNTVSNTVSVSSGSMSTFIQGKLIPSPIYRSFGIIINGCTSLPSIANPAIILGVTYKKLFETSNSFGALTYCTNRTNIYISSICCSVSGRDQGSIASDSNVTFYLVKNPSSLYNILYTSTSTFCPLWQKEQSNTFLTMGLSTTITVTAPGMGCNGGTIIAQFGMGTGNTVIYDTSALNIYASEDDSYYITFSGSLGAYEAAVAINASLNWQINM